MAIKKYLFGVAFALVGIGAAHAADIARPVYKAAPMVAPVYNWSGFYIGGHAGVGWTDLSVRIVDIGTAPYPQGTVFNAKPDGFLGGLQAGMNWQTGAWVFGIEGEYAWASLASTSIYNSTTVPGFTSTQEKDLDYVATVAGRIGYAWDNSLLYAKGGWGWTHTSTTSVTRNAAGIIANVGLSDHSSNGWLIGAGWEYGFAPNWSLKVEYNYIDFGSSDSITRFSNGTEGVRHSTLDMQIVKAGLNYRFDWGKSPIIAKY